MTQVAKTPKFPKFIGLLHSKGLNMKTFTKLLNDKGYSYHYGTVRKKLIGDTSMDFEDIVVFAEVMKVDESIFFNE